MGQKPCGPFGEGPISGDFCVTRRLQCFCIAHSSFLELASNSALRLDASF